MSLVKTVASSTNICISGMQNGTFCDREAVSGYFQSIVNPEGDRNRCWFLESLPRWSIDESTTTSERGRTQKKRKRANKKSEKTRNVTMLPKSKSSRRASPTFRTTTQPTVWSISFLSHRSRAGSWNKDDFASWEQSPLRDDQLKLLEYREVSTINASGFANAPKQHDANRS